MLFYQLILAASVLSCAGSAGFLLAPARDRRAAQLLALLLLAGGVWSACELLASAAGDAESARVWIRLAAFGWLCLPLLLPLVVLRTFEGGGADVSAWRRPLLVAFSLQSAFAVLLLVGLWSGDRVIGEVSRVPWGWTFRPGLGLYLFHALSSSSVVVCCLSIRRMLPRLSTSESLQRPWLWIAILAPTVLILTTDLAAPLLEIDVPRLGGASFAVTGLIAVWQTIYYGLSVMSPTRFSDEILEVLEDGVALVNVDGSIRRANGGLSRLSGYSAAELLGMRMARLVEPETEHGVDDVRRVMVRAGGSRIPVLASMQVLRDLQQNPVGVVVVLRDRRELEDLRRSAITNARLAAVGELAAGIAHEINNPVAFVGTNLRVLREHLEKLPEAAQKLGAAGLLEIVAEGRELIDESLEGVDRTAEIVRGVKRFTHAGTDERQLASLDELLDEIILMARPQIPTPGVVIERAYGELPRIECSPQELKQVFLNLLVNAVQAVAGSGKVRVSTSTSGDLAIVSFEDDGCGVRPEIIDRIFDPFFTTKPVGEGTGLGLGIAHQIVTLHAGVITVQSEHGSGTTFRVHLPLGSPG